MSSSLARTPVGVVGASGYTGRELLRILGRHPDVQVAWATSRSEIGEPSEIRGLSYIGADDVAVESAEVIFLCLPHGEAVTWAERINGSRRVVDLTADHRPGSGREGGAVYGMAEQDRERIREATLVANPGCYPTGAILALRPLLDAGIIDSARPVIVNAASGVTGAGRSPKRELLFAEVSGDFRAYSLGNRHRHLAEMQATLPGLQLLFTPHLLPIPRGILETIYLPVREGVGAEQVRQILRARYAGSPVVTVFDDGVPGLAGVVGTDRIDLGVAENDGMDPPLLTLVSALDNLGKGAAGQAVQNLNIMLDLPEERGLRC